MKLGFEMNVGQTCDSNICSDECNSRIEGAVNSERVRIRLASMQLAWIKCMRCSDLDLFNKLFLTEHHGIDCIVGVAAANV